MRYVHQDHLGSTSRTCPEPVERVTDDTDRLYEASYGPWGNVSASTGTADTDRLYTGQRFDSATGLYYYNARYYDPTLARFISPDTIVPGVGDPQAWNRYAYVLGNPLRYVDPLGNKHRTITESLEHDEEYNALRPGSSAAVSMFLRVSRAINYEHYMERLLGGTLAKQYGDDRLEQVKRGTTILVSRTENQFAITVTEPSRVTVSNREGFSQDVTVKKKRPPWYFWGNSVAMVPSIGSIRTKDSPDHLKVSVLVHEAKHTVQRDQFGDGLFSAAYLSPDPAFRRAVEAEARAASASAFDDGDGFGGYYWAVTVEPHVFNGPNHRV